MLLLQSTCFSYTYKYIIVVINCLSKQQQFIALENLNVQTIVYAFIEHIQRKERFPSTIMSNYRAQFISYFQKELCVRIGVAPKLSIAYYLETNSQTKVTNASLKCYLRAYVNYIQDNQVNQLSITQLAINNYKNILTRVALALATKGYLLRIGIELDIVITLVQLRVEQCEGLPGG